MPELPSIASTAQFSPSLLSSTVVANFGLASKPDGTVSEHTATVASHAANEIDSERRTADVPR